MKKQAVNPILPIDEYIADGEPHVYDGRIYLFGSHDQENGETFCMNDYVFYSAPVEDLSDWSNKGISYRAVQDPLYNETTRYMYAPDVVKGNDGKYYLYYCMSGYKGRGGYSNPISVAVADKPDGPFEFLGFVKDRNGKPYTKHLCFDPALINDDGIIRLYYGTDYPQYKDVTPESEKRRIISDIACVDEKDIEDVDNYMGAYMVELEDDMLTIRSEATRIDDKISGKGYDKHMFFEGSSIRKIKDKYYFIYSSTANHELCYAISDRPDRDFVFKGTIISNGDIGIKGRKIEDSLNTTGTNHGSIEYINGQWYVFYHRLTHNCDYSRQACSEKIEIKEDGTIAQVEVTSCGLNDGPLKAEGRYPAVICCNLTNGKMPHISNQRTYAHIPYISSGNNERFIAQIIDDTLIAYKYFEFDGKTKLIFNCRKGKGTFEVSIDNEKSITMIDIEESEDWKEFSTTLDLKGTYPLYVRYKGTYAELLDIGFEKD